ncbi:hypothetical protein CesoFtcFv8_025891 [Champsocephalus esox]|uniref:Uncharacterized protein n=2 Tax=Champsocephalus TaxID=52236 RepID=A0AAN8H1D1_CHAGU|nr:hypothetical protein CesoFtcFv8_025891 [Champsocephalus esox]KAK5895749.1 hypothetical protein CgunFtcFv8_009415 [Champsocephalus gunnari]
MSVSPLPMSELSQQSSRWQQESDAPGLQITEKWPWTSGNRSTTTAAAASASGPEWADRSVNQWLPEFVF